MPKISDTITRKFIEVKNISDWEVETETGFVDILSSNKTIEYEVFQITLENGLMIKCADTHILIDEYYNEVFAIDSLGIVIRTILGESKVCEIIQLDYLENMFDLSIDSNDHTFYTNGILSHNTQVVAAYILYYSLFNGNKTVAILANKATASREILSRYQLMYEYLPKFLQQGVKTWNKGDIELENGSKVFTSATSASGIRGKSCVSGDTKICIERDGKIYHVEIQSLINNSKLVNIENPIMKYSIYKTINKLNDEIYVGLHSIIKENVLFEKTESGSIFEDGYLGSGELIKTAISKYGPENFYQELIGIYDTKKEAESVEKEMVSIDFISSIPIDIKSFSQSDDLVLGEIPNKK